MNILQTATNLFISKLGDQAGNIDSSQVMSGLQNLLPTSGKELDLTGLVSMFQSSGSGALSLVTSWLSDGSNSKFELSDVVNLFGEGKVNEFSQGLGISKEQAADGLSGMIPNLINESSSGGNLLAQKGSSLLRRGMKNLFG